MAAVLSSCGLGKSHSSLASPKSVLDPLWAKVQQFVQTRLQQIGPPKPSRPDEEREPRQKTARLIFLFEGRDLTQEERFLSDRIAVKLKGIWEELRKTALADTSFFPQDAHLNDQGLPDDSLVMQRLIAEKMAEILVLPSGTINLGLVEDLQRHFPSPYSERLGAMNSNWQVLLRSVRIPTSKVSQLLIRADLGLAPEQEITLVHCKRVILAAALAQRANPDHLQVLEDLITLCGDGSVTRPIEGKPTLFFFVNTLADDALTRPIGLKPDGTTLTSSRIPIWQCPNFIAACKQMGIQDVEKEVREFLAAIPEQNLPKQTWEDLIIYTSHQDERIACLGRYGFTRTQLRLLSAYNAARISFPEGRSDGPTRSRINRAVSKTLKCAWDASTNPVFPRLAAKIQRVFERSFDQALRLIYNQKSRKIQLYTKEGESIELPQDFQRLIERTFQNTVSDESIFEESYCKMLLQEMEKKILEVIKRADFMSRLLKNYDPENKRYPDPARHYATLNTPMTSNYPIDELRIRSIDIGGNFHPYDPNPEQPKDAYDWLKRMMGLADWERATEDAAQIDEGGDIAIQPIHPFTSIFARDPMNAFLNSPHSAEVFIEQMIEKGKLVSRWVISKDLRSQIQNELMFRATGGCRELTSLLEIQMSAFDRYEMSVKEFSHHLFDVMLDLFRLDQKRAAEFGCLLDLVLIDNLPRELKSSLLETVFPFEQSLQSIPGSPLYFCAYFNVRTETWQLGVANQERSFLQPINEFSSGSFLHLPELLKLPQEKGKKPQRKCSEI